MDPWSTQCMDNGLHVHTINEVDMNGSSLWICCSLLAGLELSLVSLFPSFLSCRLLFISCWEFIGETVEKWGSLLIEEDLACIFGLHSVEWGTDGTHLRIRCCSNCSPTASEEVLSRSGYGRRKVVQTIRRRQLKFFVHNLRKEGDENFIVTGRIEGKRVHERQRQMFLEAHPAELMNAQWEAVVQYEEPLFVESHGRQRPEWTRQLNEWSLDLTGRTANIAALPMSSKSCSFPIPTQMSIGSFWIFVLR